MKTENVIEAKSKKFAINIIRMYQYLTQCKKEFVLSKQVLRSGTSIGANIREALRAQSRADFHSKLCIALKESNETEYWLELLHATDFLSPKQFEIMKLKCNEISKILMAICKKTNQSL